MISRSRPSSVPRLAPPSVIEEYTLDERELAALEQLYDFPGRAGLAASSVTSSTASASSASSAASPTSAAVSPTVRATSIIDTLSQMARAGQGAPLGELVRETVGERTRSPSGEKDRVAPPEMNASLSGERVGTQSSERVRTQSSERARPPSAEERRCSTDEATRDAINHKSQSQPNNPSEIFSEKLRDPSTQRRPAGGGSPRGCVSPVDNETGDSEVAVKANGQGEDGVNAEVGAVTHSERQNNLQVEFRQRDPHLGYPRQANTRQDQRQLDVRQGPHRPDSRPSDSRHTSPWQGSPPLGCEAAIARLLEAAARSPAPPVPTRRPDLTRLNLPRRSRGRDQRPPPPTSRHDTPAGSAGRVRAVLDLARGGDIAKLDAALSALEPTAALADRHGNTVAHVLAACGHVLALTWLADTCSHGLAETLWRENGRGLTPCLAAVRCGRLEVVQWLVDRSPTRSHLLPGDGADSLLHSAARLGQAEIVSWCADRLLQHRTNLDGADQRRDTALHLAAATGNTLVCRALLDRGATVTARNACGLKPYDVAAQTGHHACAEYLLTFETLADLAGDFCSLEAEAARLSRGNTDYKDNFREVLSVARKLLRERNELGGALRELRDEWQLLQERLLRQLQQAAAEQRQLRRQLHEADPTAEDCGSPQPGEAAPAELAEQLAALRDRWQHCSAAGGDALVSESQSRLEVVEALWHRLRASRKDPTQPLTSVQEIVRNKIGDIRAQAAPGRLLDRSVLSSSDDSLIESELLQGAPPTPPPRPPGCVPPSTPYTSRSTNRVLPPTSFLPISAGRISAPTKTTLERSFDSGGSGGPANSSFPPLSVDGSRLSRRDLGFRRRSQRFSHLERRGKSADPIERSTFHNTPSENSSGDGGLWPASDLSRSLDWTSPSPRRRAAAAGNESVQLARAELRRRLRQLALVSESGSAAVLDVIEPSGSEAGSAEDLVRLEVEAQRRARARSAPPRPSSDAREVGGPGEHSGDGDTYWLDAAGDDGVGDGAGNGDSDRRVDDLLCQRMESDMTTESSQWRAAGRTMSPGRCRDTDGSERSGRSGRSDRAGRDGRGGREGREGSAGRVGRADRTPPDDHTPPGSTPILSKPDILQGTRHWRDPGEESDELSPEKPDLPLFQLGNTTPSTAAAANDATSACKKRSFLQKFNIRARWTPKRRERPTRPGQEITAVDFRETYSSEARDDTLSVQENAANEEAEGPPPPLLPRGGAAPAEARRVGRESVSSQGEVRRPEVEGSHHQLESAANESNFLDGSGTGDLFTAVCVNTYADSASESSRSVVSRRSRQSSSPGRPLLSGGSPPFGAVGPQGVVVSGGASDDSNRSVSGVTSVNGVSMVSGINGVTSGTSASRPASSASAVPPGRHSPAASEASRTESTLAPPSDVSVTESARHLPAAGGIGGVTVRTTGGATWRMPGGGAEPPAADGQRTAQQRCDGAPLSPPSGHTKLVSENGVSPRRADRPWYEISDDD